jgi:hypothetical protein
VRSSGLVRASQPQGMAVPSAGDLPGCTHPDLGARNIPCQIIHHNIKWHK